jgi:hypothetical protein
MTPTVTPTATATPLVRVCTVGGSGSQVGLQFRNVVFVGNLRLTSNISGTQSLTVGPLIGGTGVRNIGVPYTSIFFDPVVINGPFGITIRACVTAQPQNGSGKIDCNGGEPGYNLTQRQDHNTSNAPGSNGGQAQDPECDNTLTRPDGSVSSACQEGVSCSSATHATVCNSPVEYTQAGTFPNGGFAGVEYLQLRIVNNVGGDGQQCTNDDSYGAPINIPAFITTGTARATIYDANNSGNNLIDQAHSTCSDCITQVAGSSPGCTQIVNTSLSGFKFVTAFPGLDLDSTAGDAAVTIEASCQ